MAIEVETFANEPAGTSASLKFRAGFAHPDTPYFEMCSDSVRGKYRERFGVVVPEPDLFLTARDNTFRSPTFGQTFGAAGLTSAADGALPSEEYLDLPVEWVCGELVDEPYVDRSRIAEMGPIASFYPGAGLFLLRALPQIAQSAGYDFLLASLTKELQDIAAIAGWEFHIRTTARPVDWGPYYATKPSTGILRCA